MFDPTTHAMTESRTNRSRLSEATRELIKHRRNAGLKMREIASELELETKVVENFLYHEQRKARGERVSSRLAEDLSAASVFTEHWHPRQGRAKLPGLPAGSKLRPLTYAQLTGGKAPTRSSRA